MTIKKSRNLQLNEPLVSPFAKTILCKSLGSALITAKLSYPNQLNYLISWKKSSYIVIYDLRVKPQIRCLIKFWVTGQLINRIIHPQIPNNKKSGFTIKKEEEDSSNTANVGLTIVMKDQVSLEYLLSSDLQNDSLTVILNGITARTTLYENCSNIGPPRGSEYGGDENPPFTSI